MNKRYRIPLWVLLWMGLNGPLVAAVKVLETSLKLFLFAICVKPTHQGHNWTLARLRGQSPQSRCLIAFNQDRRRDGVFADPSPHGNHSVCHLLCITTNRLNWLLFVPPTSLWLLLLPPLSRKLLHITNPNPVIVNELLRCTIWLEVSSMNECT